MQREKRKSSIRQSRTVPTIIVDKIDSSTTNSTSLNNSRSSRDKYEEIKIAENAYEPNNNQAKRTLIRTDTINEEDLTGEIKDSNDSSEDSDEWSKVCDDDDNDESITMEEKMLQREIIKNFVHIKRKTQEAPVFNRSLTDRDTIMPSRFSSTDPREKTIAEEESDLTESEISDQDE